MTSRASPHGGPPPGRAPAASASARHGDFRTGRAAAARVPAAAATQQRADEALITSCDSRRRGRASQLTRTARRVERDRLRPVDAAASKCQRYGGTSQDQPSTSPAPSVSHVTSPRPGTSVSSATRPDPISQNRRRSRPRGKDAPPRRTDTVATASASAPRCRRSSPANSREAQPMRSSGRASSSVRRADSRSRLEARGLRGDVDAGGAPGDAPAAAHAARSCRTGRARCPACGVIHCR